MLKLMKLMYLAERESYQRYGRPMIGDVPYADKHGPVLDAVYKSAAYVEEAGATWKALISPRDGNVIRLCTENPELKKLSASDRKVLDALWDEHKDKSASKLRNWTHEHLQEYVELSFPDWAPRKPIELKRMLVAIGLSEQEAEEVIAEQERDERLDAQLMLAA